MNKEEKKRCCALQGLRLQNTPLSKHIMAGPITYMR